MAIRTDEIGHYERELNRATGLIDELDDLLYTLLNASRADDTDGRGVRMRAGIDRAWDDLRRARDNLADAKQAMPAPQPKTTIPAQLIPLQSARVALEERFGDGGSR